MIRVDRRFAEILVAAAKRSGIPVVAFSRLWAAQQGFLDTPLRKIERFLDTPPKKIR